MNKVLQVISIGTLLAGATAAQQNVVFANPINKSTGAHIPNDSIFAVLAPQYLKGQAFHVVTAIFSDAPGQTCNSVTPGIGLASPALDIEGSFDNVVFEPIGVYQRVIRSGSNGGPNNRYRTIKSGVGPYPYLEVGVSGFDSSHCAVSVFYYGSQTELKIAAELQTGSSYLDSAFNVGVNITGSGSIINGITNVRQAIYSIMLYHTGVTEDVTLYQVLSDSSLSASLTFKSVAPNTWIQINAASPTQPIFTTSINSGTLLTLGSTGSISGFITMRFE